MYKRQYLQHAFNASDEAVVSIWLENPYWQYFTGETYLQTELPIDPSSLRRWRKRLEEAGVELLLSLTINAAKQLTVVKEKNLDRVIVDTTVMPKAIAHPTDSALLETARQHMVGTHKTFVNICKVIVTNNAKPGKLVDRFRGIFLYGVWVKWVFQGGLLIQSSWDY